MTKHIVGQDRHALTCEILKKKKLPSSAEVSISLSNITHVVAVYLNLANTLVD